MRGRNGAGGRGRSAFTAPADESRAAGPLGYDRISPRRLGGILTKAARPLLTSAIRRRRSRRRGGIWAPRGSTTHWTASTTSHTSGRTGGSATTPTGPLLSSASALRTDPCAAPVQGPTAPPPSLGTLGGPGRGRASGMDSTGGWALHRGSAPRGPPEGTPRFKGNSKRGIDREEGLIAGLTVDGWGP